MSHHWHDDSTKCGLQVCGEPEEVSAAYAQHVPGYARHRRYLTRSRSRPYEAAVEITALRSLSFGRNYVSHETVFEVQESARHVVVSVMERGAVETIAPRPGTHRQSYTGASANVVQAERGFRSVVSDASVLRAVVFPEAVVRSAVELLTGDPMDGPLIFEPRLDTGRGPGATIGEAMAMAFREFGNPGTLVFHPAASARVQDLLLTSLVLGARHNWSDRLARQRSSAAPRQVRRVEDYLVANAHRPITTAELARVAGCSARALQQAFREFRNTTPMRMLKTIRLQRAHADLMRPAGVTNVTNIASKWGFSSAGRFSAEYRKAYGRLPSETLRFGAVDEPKPTKFAPVGPLL